MSCNKDSSFFNTEVIKQSINVKAKNGSAIVVSVIETDELKEFEIDYQPYTSLIINSFSNNKALNRKGQVITQIQFDWAYNKTIESQILNSSIFTGGIYDPISDTGSSFSAIVSDLSVTTDAVVTLTADDIIGDSNSSKTKNTNIVFGNDVYYGVITGIVENPSLNFISEGIINSFLGSLTKVLKTNRTISNITCLSSSFTEREIYICPVSFGNVSFKFNTSFTDGGFVLVRTMNITNENGFTESYNVYLSFYGNLSSLFYDAK